MNFMDFILEMLGMGELVAVRALFALKGFIESPDDNPITKALGE